MACQGPLLRDDIAPGTVEASRARRGGWTRETLAEWGVPWPPPAGWREQLRRNWENRMARLAVTAGERALRAEKRAARRGSDPLSAAGPALLGTPPGLGVVAAGRAA
ncbi:hypothetical protein [Paractinoplanes brasiliensis]|uniref:Uncharacterized protein n=1 Tax=Paractinoplanes brasiliensis TaxID=52695 RepID=A0A4V3C7J2_9ACTN|nr:hypothetical protein [Actinoplanes brasiliensis]TDO37888.1 hypothetical protein C8E87_1524 [Actinoplanes brasiliensis]